MGIGMYSEFHHSDLVTLKKITRINYLCCVRC